ncbi:MAG: hypothetical protein KJP26_08185 [Maribacter sp.]|nr:hypothetical protein [Maribacter sp.]
MGTLIVKRNPEWINKARNIGIYVDGKKVGTIMEGERKSYDLESGTFNINGKIDWCRSPIITVNIKDNETKEIVIKGFKYANIIMPIGMGSMVLFFLFNLLLKLDLKFLLVGGGLGFLYILYFITLGRNNYLSIQESS